MPRRRPFTFDATRIAQWLAIASALVALLSQATQLAERLLALLGGPR